LSLITQDYHKAMAWWEQGAKYGSPESEYSLGALFELGQGVEQDFQKALYWYRAAADHGNGLAITRVASLYEKGHGNPDDPDKVMKWAFDMASKAKP